MCFSFFGISTMYDYDPTYVPGSSNRGRKAQLQTQNAPDLECATPELSQGYRILQALIGISRYFLELPDHTEKGMRDYYDVISKPVCFREIQRKFADGEYTKISEFVVDVRCLLLNCYTYFGPNDVHTKKALKIEQVLEQKLALLPVDVRALCCLEAENTGTIEYTEGVQSQLLQSVIGERSRRESERKQRLLEEYSKEKEGKEHDLLLWEQERLFTGTDREKMESMWELAAIGHFVALSLEQLNISSISMFELERMVFMPRASKSLALLMTTLLSTPLCRLKLHTKPPMPYRIWTKKLELKVSYWYKMYIKSDKNANFMFEKFGIEHQFWKILGDWNPLEEYEFHELTVYQRVILIKAVCDYILQNHKILRDTVAEKRDEFGKCLGQDRSGAKFFYFPQLLDQCIRIYRQTSEPKSWIERDLEYAERLGEKCNGGTTRNKKRRGRKPGNRGKIVREKPQPDIDITRKSLRSSHKPTEISVNILASTVDQAIGCSNHGTTVCDGKICSNKSDLELLGNEHSTPQTGQSPSNINENLPEETRNEPSINTSYSTDMHLETGLNSSQTSVSEDIYTSHNESHHNKCSNESADSVSICNLESKQVCDVNCNNKVLPVIVEDENNFIAEQSECVNAKSMPSHEPKNVDEDGDKFIKVSKTRRLLYNPHWLEPNPDDFRLVVDTVDGVRQLLTKYCDDDSVVISRRSHNKSGKGSRPSCEVKLFRQLSSLVSDLDCVEIKILTNTRSAREKLYNEWVEFNNRPTGYVDPDEAFWLNEKEPVETSECQTLETQPSQTSDVLEDMELPQTQVTDHGDTAEDTQDICVGGMKLRHRVATKEKCDGLETSEVSSEVDSDDSDNWVVSRNRKNRRKKRKKGNPALLNSSKKKRTSEECLQQSSLNPEEASPKLAQDSSSQVKIVHGVAKVAAKKRRVRKNLFPQNEASIGEGSHELQQGENGQKLVNSAANKSHDAAVDDTFIPMVSLSQTGKMTIRDIDTKTLLPSQGRKRGNVVRTVKNIEKGDVVIDTISLVMEKGECHESVTQSMEVEVCNGKVQAVKPSYQNSVNVSERPEQTHGQEAVHRPVCVTSYKKSHKVVKKHVGLKKSDIRGNEKQATGVPVLTPPSGQVRQAHVVTKSQSVPAANCQRSSSSGTGGKAPSTCVGQGQENKNLKQSVDNVQPVVQAETDIICISDESDDEVECLGSHYNPKLDPTYVGKKLARIKPEQSAVKAEGNLTPQQTHVAPKTDLCLQREVPTSGMEAAAASTGRNVTTLPNHFQTQVPNPDSNTTYLTSDSAVIHDKVEEDHKNVGIHAVAENQDSVSEAVLTAQPSGRSCSVAGNSVLQTEAIGHGQNHIPGLGTASTVFSPLPPSSTQNNPYIPVRTQDSMTPKQTHIAPKSDPYVQRKIPASGIEAAASTGSSVTPLPNHFQTLVPNHDINTTYLMCNSTIIHEKVEEEFPVKHKNVEIERMQSHIPGFGTASTVLSPLLPSSTQNSPNIPAHHSVAVHGTIPSIQQSSSMSSGRVHNLQINVGSQVVSSHVPASQVSNVNPYIVIVGTCPGTSVIQVTASDPTNRPPNSCTQVISSDAVLARTKSPGSKSSTASKISGTQLTQTRIPAPQLHQTGNPNVSFGKMKCSGALVDRARNCLPLSQTKDNLPVEVRSSHSPLVQVKNPVFQSTPMKSPHAPSVHTQHPDSLLASTRVPGSHVSSGTPVGHRRIPETPVTKVRNPVTSAVQIRSPATPVQTRSPATPVQTRSPTPVAHMGSPGTPFGKTRSPDKIHFSQALSPGVSVVQARNSGSPSFQAQTHDAHVNPGARLSHGRGSPRSRPERDLNDGLQLRDQTARLVVIPGDDNVSRYALVFPSGAKVVLTPEQVADIRAANGGLLISNF